MSSMKAVAKAKTAKPHHPDDNVIIPVIAIKKWSYYSNKHTFQSSISPESACVFSPIYTLNVGPWIVIETKR